MQMDEVLAGIAEDVKNFCAIYVVDVSEVRRTQGERDSYVVVGLMWQVVGGDERDSSVVGLPGPPCTRDEP